MRRAAGDRRARTGGGLASAQPANEPARIEAPRRAMPTPLHNEADARACGVEHVTEPYEIFMMRQTGPRLRPRPHRAERSRSKRVYVLASRDGVRRRARARSPRGCSRCASDRGADRCRTGACRREQRHRRAALLNDMGARTSRVRIDCDPDLSNLARARRFLCDGRHDSHRRGMRSPGCGVATTKRQRWPGACCGMPSCEEDVMTPTDKEGAMPMDGGR